MIFSLDDKLRTSDLSSDYLDSLIKSVITRIKDDEGMMAEIKEFCEEENKDNVEGKLTLQDYINMKIDEMAEDAVSRTRFYVDFDVEVKL